MRSAWINIGQDIVHMDTYGAVTGIIKPVRNRVTGIPQNIHYVAYRRPYERKGKPPDLKGA